MSAVRVEHLTFRYAGHAPPVLRDLSLQCRVGEVTWLTGAPGAGCSTLLLVLAGVAPRLTGGALTGTVRVLERDPAQAGQAAGRIAHLSTSPGAQLSGVADTVFDEVAFGPANLGWPRTRIEVAVRGALDRMGLTHLARRDPGTLSGGELQRVVLAALTALVPQVWLLDEPVSALDAASTKRTVELLRAEAARGATVVVAAEDAEFGLAVADRMVVLRDGAVVLDGRPDELLRSDEALAAGAAEVSLVALARAAFAIHPSPLVGPPYPLTDAEAVQRWMAP
jgi:energy-coupling factor transporter ATP-binding protein EcfA2